MFYFLSYFCSVNTRNPFTSFVSVFQSMELGSRLLIRVYHVYSVHILGETDVKLILRNQYEAKRSTCLGVFFYLLLFEGGNKTLLNS